MIEKRICHGILRTLKDSNGYKLPDEILEAELQMRIVPPPTPNQYRDNLAHCNGKGWISMDVDDYGNRRYWLNDAGEIEVNR